MDFESLMSLVKSNRSTRRFDASRPVSESTLIDLVSLCRYCASGRNIQPLKYRLVHSRQECDTVYPSLKWAGYYPDWDGPQPDERPTAYIVQCLDTTIAPNCLCDDGIHLEAITLGARAKGLSSCIIKAFNPAEISAALKLPPSLRPLYIVALGFGVEPVRIVELDESITDGHKYYRTSDGTQCVPKRPVSSLIIK